MALDIFSRKEKQNHQDEFDDEFFDYESEKPISIVSVASGAYQARLDRLERFRSDLDDKEFSPPSNKEPSRLVEKHLSSVQGMISEAKAEIEKRVSIEANNKALQEEIASLQDQLKREKLAGVEKNTLCNTLKNRLHETREGLQKAHFEISDQARKIDFLKESGSEQRSIIREQELEISEFKKAREIIETDAESNRSELWSVRSAFAKSEDALRDAKAKIEDLKRIMEADIQHRERLNDEVTSIREDMTVLQAEKLEISSKYDLAMSDLEAQTKEFKSGIAEKDNSLFALEKETEDLRKEIFDLKSSITDLNSEKDDLEQKLSAEESRQTALRDQILELQSILDHEREHSLDHVSRVTELELKCAELSDENHSMVRRIKEVTTEATAAAKDVRLLQRKIKKLEVAEVKFERQIDKLKAAADSKKRIKKSA